MSIQNRISAFRRPTSLPELCIVISGTTYPMPIIILRSKITLRLPLISSTGARNRYVTPPLLCPTRLKAASSFSGRIYSQHRVYVSGYIVTVPSRMANPASRVICPEPRRLDTAGHVCFSLLNSAPAFLAANLTACLSHVGHKPASRRQPPP